MDNGSVLFKNEQIGIFKVHNNVFIESYEKGFKFEDLNEVFLEHPEIDVENFTVLKKALEEAPLARQKFGRLKERIVLSIEQNDMLAWVTFNVSKVELEADNRANLILELVPKLKSMGILFGIKSELLSEELEPGKPYIIAEGIPPEDGTDSIINMFQFKDIKPETFENEKVDYYDMTLITTVEDNTWLGERIEATAGKPGTTVRNELIEPKKGKTYPLLYDKETVYELAEGKKTVLYSKEYGAVYYLDGKIATMNPLVITGDVGPKTGNIVFDGFVIIYGTVCDGYFVEATKDIEIKGELGLGNVKGVVSTGGSIFIKGGVLSKGDSVIKAKQNVYTKFADNVEIDCEESIHIGYYCFNSKISARDIVFDSTKGQVIGGEVKAKCRVIVPIIGSELEKRTVLEVAGFERDSIKKELNEVIDKLNSIKMENQNVKDSLLYLERQESLSMYQIKLKYENIQRMEEIREEIKSLDLRRRNLETYMETRGEGEIRITMKVFPNTLITIKKLSMEITKYTIAANIFVTDGKLKMV